MIANVEQINDTCAVIRFMDELTINNAFEIRDCVGKENDRGCTEIVIDMSEVTYIDSTALGTMVAIHKEAKENGQKMVISGVNENFRRLLTLTRLDTFFEVYDSCEDALRCL